MAGTPSGNTIAPVNAPTLDNGRLGDPPANSAPLDRTMSVAPVDAPTLDNGKLEPLPANSAPLTGTPNSNTVAPVNAPTLDNGRLEPPPANSAPLVLARSAPVADADYTNERCQLILKLDMAREGQLGYLDRINDPMTSEELRKSLAAAIAILGGQVATYTVALERLETARVQIELATVRPSAEQCRQLPFQPVAAEPANQRGRSEFSRQPWGTINVGH